MTTTTTDRPVASQLKCAAILKVILSDDELTEATWTLYPRSFGGGELVGQISGLPLDSAHAAVDGYILALGLTSVSDTDVPGGDTCADFTKVSAIGEYLGVPVRIWCAADKKAATR